MIKTQLFISNNITATLENIIAYNISRLPFEEAENRLNEINRIDEVLTDSLVIANDIKEDRKDIQEIAPILEMSIGTAQLIKELTYTYLNEKFSQLNKIEIKAVTEILKDLDRWIKEDFNIQDEFEIDIQSYMSC